MVRYNLNEQQAKKEKPFSFIELARISGSKLLEDTIEATLSRKEHDTLNHLER